jgi:hypothetical protein
VKNCLRTETRFQDRNCWTWYDLIYPIQQKNMYIIIPRSLAVAEVMTIALGANFKACRFLRVPIRKERSDDVTQTNLHTSYQET